MSVRVTDRGATQLLLRAALLAKRCSVSVGVNDAAGHYEDGTAVVDVAEAHEFGLGNVPQRSFLRAWFDKKRGAFGPDLNKLARNVLKNGIGPMAALQVLGDRYVVEIQERMDKHIPPALQKDTVTRKARTGSTTPNTPLEDTHRLRNSIKARVKA